MKKLLKNIYNALGFYYIFKKLGIININVIKIDGGLGSQIISYMQYFYRIQKNSKVKVDISFFNIPVNNELFIKKCNPLIQIASKRINDIFYSKKS